MSPWSVKYPEDLIFCNPWYLAWIQFAILPTLLSLIYWLPVYYFQQTTKPKHIILQNINKDNHPTHQLLINTRNEYNSAVTNILSQTDNLIDSLPPLPTNICAIINEYANDDNAYPILQVIHTIRIKNFIKSKKFNSN